MDWACCSWTASITGYTDYKINTCRILIEEVETNFRIISGTERSRCYPVDCHYIAWVEIVYNVEYRRSDIISKYKKTIFSRAAEYGVTPATGIYCITAITIQEN